MESFPHSLVRRLQKLEDYLFFSVAVAALGLAVLSGYTLVYRAALKLWLAWTAPLAFLVAGGVLLWLVWQRLSVLRALRAGGEPATPAAPPPLGLRLLPRAAALGYLVLFLLVAGVSLRAVYADNHLAGLVFALLYASLTWLEAQAAWGLRSEAAAGADLRTLLLPGGLNLARAGAFWLGFAAPLATMGLQAAQLPYVNFFFQRDKAWTAAADVPLAAMLGLGLLGFLLLEGFFGQAAGAWQRLNRGGCLPCGKWAVIGRWMVGMVLATLLGGTPLLALAALLVLHQTLTHGWDEGWQERHPGRAVLLAALAPALFYMGGALAWLGQSWSYTVVLALVPSVFFLALAQAAGERKTTSPLPSPEEERGRALAQEGQEKETAPLPSPGLESGRALAQEGEEIEPLAGDGGDPLHALFTRTRLARWQATGFAAAGFASFVLLIFLLLAESCRFYNSLISPNFARCIPTGGEHMAYFELGGVNGTLLAFDLVIVFLLLGWGLSRLFRPLDEWVQRLPQQTRRWLGWILIGVTVALIIVALVVERGSWLAAAVLVRGLAAGVRRK